MRAVNLLPESSRPTRASGTRGGSAYFVIGVLALLVVGVLTYVVTANQVSSRQAEAQKAEKQAAEANARAQKLAAFGDFAQVKATREQSVAVLAGSRYDWERTLRELARVLPKGVFVTSLDATSGGIASGASQGASAGGADAAAGPNMKIAGCAPDHREVATTLVRLKSIHGVTDVKLSDSTKGDAGGGGSNQAGASGSAGAGGCPEGATTFNATVVLTPTAVNPAPNAPKVPVSLGGGS